MVSTRVFFCFDFSEDLWRASVVRNRWVADPSQCAGGFWDRRFSTGTPPSGVELERFVDEQIDESDLTIVLIGRRTSACPYVRYAIHRTVEVGHGLLGIRVDQCRDRYGSPGVRGRNPFDDIIVNHSGRELAASEFVETFDWVDDDGFSNLPRWVDDAMARRSTDSRPVG